MGASTHDENFGAFFRRYARTWQHGVAAAALTAFGTLTFVHRGFAVVGLAAYVIPPIVLYLGSSSLAGADEGGTGADGGTAVGDADEGSSRGGGAAVGAGSADAGADRSRAARGGDADGFDSDADSTDVDTDADGVDSDTDSDGVDTDGDTDSAGVDEDEDADADGAAESAGPSAGWRTADAPTDADLRDAAVAGEAAYAVGDGGAVVADRGDGWTVALADGPGAGGEDLRGVAAADGAVWVAGDGGAVGRLDPETGRHVDHSAPGGDTSNVAAVAAAGPTDDETLLLADGSGGIRRGRYRDGELAWDDPVTPASGSSLADVTLVDADVGFACDTSGAVLRTTDGGRSFETLDVGADGTPTAVAALGPERAWACDDDGTLHRFDGRRWTPDRLTDGPLHALATTEPAGLATGDGGAAFEREGTDAGWEHVTTPASAALEGAALGGGRAVAVGADGTVVERTLDG